MKEPYYFYQFLPVACCLWKEEGNRLKTIKRKKENHISILLQKLCRKKVKQLKRPKDNTLGKFVRVNENVLMSVKIIVSIQ